MEGSHRKICEFSQEELTHAAYYRHLNDKTGATCHRKRSRLAPQIPSDDEGSASEEVFSNSDIHEHAESTFDFGSESDTFTAEDNADSEGDELLDEGDLPSLT